jgi:hypothetical protein
MTTEAANRLLTLLRIKSSSASCHHRANFHLFPPPRTRGRTNEGDSSRNLLPPVIPT